jgi:hypothetical protein
MHFTLLVRSRCQDDQDCPDHVILEIKSALQAEITA